MIIIPQHKKDLSSVRSVSRTKLLGSQSRLKVGNPSLSSASRWTSVASQRRLSTVSSQRSHSSVRRKSVSSNRMAGSVGRKSSLLGSRAARYRTHDHLTPYDEEPIDEDDEV